ncbi:MAG: glycosyltransferase family 61 protein [Cyanobacteria bacterium J06626_18]
MRCRRAQAGRRWWPCSRSTGRTLQEQAELFATAEVVLAIHGSGLTNTVFC